MFAPTDRPRVFALPPGVDFPAALVAGLRQRLDGEPPEAMARVALIVNTARMRRRVEEVFRTGPPCLLPKISLLSDFAQDPLVIDQPMPENPLALRFRLMQLTRALLEQQPELAPRETAFDLADSLGTLFAELSGEGVAPEALARIDTGAHAQHWARSQVFLGIASRFLAETPRPDADARQRAVIETLVQNWAESPPGAPVIVAGSTGSRGSTFQLMQAVARLPQGAVVLPGFDRAMSIDIWDALRAPASEGLRQEDHPQFRFLTLLDGLGLDPSALPLWDVTPPPSPARNALVSLALRPAPVTDGWMRDGKTLTDLDAAAAGMTLLAAPSPRIEALCIALRLREAAQSGQRAALISPDRVLTRQVTAALQRWGIEPDDSAGRPLAQSPPGRLLRQIAELMHSPCDPARLLAFLKHPLVARAERGVQTKNTRDLELAVIRKNSRCPSPQDIRDWAAERDAAERMDWAGWLASLLEALAAHDDEQPENHVTALCSFAERAVAGPSGAGADELWAQAAGRKARAVIDQLAAAIPQAGRLNPAEFARVLDAVLAGEEVRDPDKPHPGIMIWGTLEARVQGADLMILAGLNEGVWPGQVAPDPWLNRSMRAELGLLSPEREIGLSAHDFQQAVAGREVWLTRALRDAETETVPSRWLNRLHTLMKGIGPESAAALDAMEDRGKLWLERARALETVTQQDPAPRPAPRPPVATRPRGLSVTQIETWIRDPYAIYARHILGLRPLEPISLTADAMLRGSAVHKAMERFTLETMDGLGPDAEARLIAIAREELVAAAPEDSLAALWSARLERVAADFLGAERARRRQARPIAVELKGSATDAETGFRLTGQVDRIDIDSGGSITIWDYKTGQVPSRPQRTHFARQLPLLAALARRGAFEGIDAPGFCRVGYLRIGNDLGETQDSLGPEAIDAVWEELARRVRAFERRAQGYTARRYIEKDGDATDYDQLSRFGEWDHATAAQPLDVGGSDE